MSEFAPEDSPYLFKSLNELGVTFDLLLNRGLLPLNLDNIGRASPVPDLKEPGFTPVYRNHGFKKCVKEALTPEMTTVHSIFAISAKEHADKPCLAERPYDFSTKISEPRYESITYKEVNQQKIELGSGILFLLQNNPYKVKGLPAHDKIDLHVDNYTSYNKDDFSFVLTIFAANRAKWAITDLATASYSITNSCLYDTLGPNASRFILATAESPIVVCAGAHVEEVLKLKESFPEDLKSLIAVVSMDPLTSLGGTVAAQKATERAEAAGIKLYDWEQVLGVGRLFPLKELPPSKETPFTISFTSGTTGANPKGVLLTHKAAAAGILFPVSLCAHPDILRDFCFLPLAHIFERQCMLVSLCRGALIGFPQYGGTPLTLLEDLQIFKPSYMANVPRVYTKIEAALKNATTNAPSALTKSIFSRLVQTKMDLQSQYDGAEGRHWFYDNVLLPKVRAKLGFENMQYVITGSAPISPSSVKFLKAILNIGFSQGYGLTESFAGISISIPFEKEPGSCGPIALTGECRLRDLPEMGYRVDDPERPAGEMLLRGPQIFSHYYKNEEETNKALKDGWFYTGDVAKIDPATGTFQIIDRVKNFFKLAQGEYVTPEKVENSYLSSNLILTQAFAHGDSLRHYLVGILGVDEAPARDFLVKRCNVARGSLTSQEAILEEINKRENKTKLLEHLNKNLKGLFGFEQLHNISIEFEPLRLERDVITATMKIRRPIAAKYFEDKIEKLYEEGPLISKVKM